MALELKSNPVFKLVFDPTKIYERPKKTVKEVRNGCLYVVALGAPKGMF